MVSLALSLDVCVCLSLSLLVLGPLLARLGVSLCPRLQGQAEAIKDAVRRAEAHEEGKRLARTAGDTTGMNYFKQAGRPVSLLVLECLSLSLVVSICPSLLLWVPCLSVLVCGRLC